MKVILLKDCKDGKANTIVEVSPGYGSNFLIKNGFGVPYNPKTAKALEKTLDKIVADEHEKRAQMLELKEQLEQLRLKFELTANIDGNKNLNVHGSISTKEVDKKLKELGFKVDKHALSKIHLVSEGLHEVVATLYKDIKAIIHIEIQIHVKK
ncbi:50S ribosomal protein L9 [Mycoplasmopsis gallopavonis]|uniref:Large ribosomal subunit protein bL9 n=1 Tax=Mycoplasmopsis gallopavonis TaxID=76629 RepID=A0A449AZV8_9BACT|nr:50S ribosomal protein L9 [Mycoplasmopsis gallopavonis]RIV16896.1 50S ribosomal protein L9 [Mycoplasmopsis gallopavonis]VEU73024.1 50S ribosomal protein L9 [Mycoplasmopsis gallopavonis]